MRSIREILMQRDQMSSTEAELLISDAQAQFHEYLAEGDQESAYGICKEFFGLEPDYLFDIL